MSPPHVKPSSGSQSRIASTQRSRTPHKGSNSPNPNIPKRPSRTVKPSHSSHSESYDNAGAVHSNLTTSSRVMDRRGAKVAGTKQSRTSQGGDDLVRPMSVGSLPRQATRNINTASHSPNNSAESIGWTSWPEVRLKVFGLPPDTKTLRLAEWFRHEGTITYIEVYDMASVAEGATAVIAFRPPPKRPFWEFIPYSVKCGNGEKLNLTIRLDSRPKTFFHRSPINPSISYPEHMVLQAVSLDFGVMSKESMMLSLRQILPTKKKDIEVRQNMLYRELSIEFPYAIRDQRKPKLDQKPLNYGKFDRDDIFKFSIPFSHLKAIQTIDLGDDTFAIQFSLGAPPRFFKKMKDLETHDEYSSRWTIQQSWYRQTDIVYSPASIRGLPLTIKKTRPLIDLGRWITYCLVFSKSNLAKFNFMAQALQDYNVSVHQSPGLGLVRTSNKPIWDHLDRSLLHVNSKKASLSDLMQEDVLSLDFEVRYQLEVCMSHGYLSEYNMGPDFLQKLANLKVSDARDVLEGVANRRENIYDPLSIFESNPISGTTKAARIPKYCVLVRAATVTPTTVYFHTPTVETSNRVLRQYPDHVDRFLRVRFTDEKGEGKIFSNNNDASNELYTRVKRTLNNGIRIGDRFYEFLAFGNSQFREHGAYFFSPLSHLDARRIRMWMGDFTDIRTVAKYASRIGQCFSTTRAVANVVPVIREIADVERNGFTFTDGVGRISPFLTQLTATQLGLVQTAHGPPSVYQFRLGGCKGILATSPASKPQEIHLRHSQYKFAANHEGLDIIRWSQFACAKLNRQLILVLSALGVPDEIFLNKLRTQLQDLELAMTDPKKALALLQKYVDHNQMTLTLASMVLDGFQMSKEPFMISLLRLWRACSIKYLKEKAQLQVSGGALLLGCVDETGTLRGHRDDVHKVPISTPMEERCRNLPQIFVQLSVDPDTGVCGKPKVVTGPMLLARNPSLHPGDIRVVQGVDVPELHHLVDVVALPQTGDRDIASMCSGGDLDGDDFLVIWDEDLLPREWNHEPMDYTAPAPILHGREITVDDLTTFFVNYMKNDSLGTIAIAHIAQADWMEEGVKADKCKQLAALHSMAVDFPKTGIPAHITPDLRPRKWPHFMEKKGKRKDQIYVSRKILGQLYDQVERVDFVPDFKASFDHRILDAYDIPDDTLITAKSIKQDYDAAMRRIMAQYEIKTEFEVWSTFVMSHNNPNDFKFHEQIGQLSANLKHQYRDVCQIAAEGKEFDRLAPFVTAMYKATADEISGAVRDGRTADMPLMSFPWIFQDLLGKIAKPNAFPQTPMPESFKDYASHRQKISTTQNKAAPSAKAGPFAAEVQTSKGVVHPGDLLELFDTPQETHAMAAPGHENANTVNVAPSPTANGGLRSVSDDRVSSFATAFSLLDQDYDVETIGNSETDGLTDVRPDSITGYEELVDISHTASPAASLDLFKSATSTPPVAPKFTDQGSLDGHIFIEKPSTHAGVGTEVGDGNPSSSSLSGEVELDVEGADDGLEEVENVVLRPSKSRTTHDRLAAFSEEEGEETTDGERKEGKGTGGEDGEETRTEE